MTPSEFVSALEVGFATTILLSRIEKECTRAITVDKTLGERIILFVGIYDDSIPEEGTSTDEFGWTGFAYSLDMRCIHPVDIRENVVFYGDELEQISNLLRMNLI